eukprot:5560419-Karenia_brevis.AAC.1
MMLMMLMMTTMMMMMVVSQAETLVTLIENQEPWAWARTDEFVGTLKAKLSSAQQDTSVIVQEILVKQDKEIKDLYEEGPLLTALNSVPLTGDMKVETLGNETKRLLRMQQQNW